MGTRKIFPDWDSIVFKGAQLARMPLNEDEDVTTKTVIGKTADHPLEIEIPFYVSHMSFGALAREAKIAMARGSRLVGTMMCSGEGGMWPSQGWAGIFQRRRSPRRSRRFVASTWERTPSLPAVMRTSRVSTT